MAQTTSPRPEVERLRGLTVSALAIAIVAGAVVADTASPAVGLVIVAATVVLGVAALLDGRTRRDEARSPLVRVLPIELERARRHRHPVALVRGVPAAGLTLARLGEHIRLLDYAWLERGEVVLLLVETGGVGATNLLARLASAGLVTGGVVAAFPEDALTTGGLLARLTPGADVVHLAPSPDSPAPVTEPAVLTSLDGDARIG